MDFALWHSAITLAAGTDGKALSDQQLTKNGVPIIVDSCIAFVTQYGELHHIYGGEKFFKKLVLHNYYFWFPLEELIHPVCCVVMRISCFLMLWSIMP